MVEKKTATLDELEAALADEHAQRDRLETLVEGLVSWQKRSQIAELQTQADLDVLQPLLAELRNLESEQVRLRDELARGQVRSPVNGTVLTRHCHTGEGAEHLQTLFTILEENSLEIVIYVPQQRIDEFQTDQTLDVSLPPFQDHIACRIARMGDENVSPPRTFNGITLIRRSYCRSICCRRTGVWNTRECNSVRLCNCRSIPLAGGTAARL